MKVLGYALLPLMFAGVPKSDPFDDYLNSIKKNQPPPDLSEMAKVCKFDLVGKQPDRGVNSGARWIPSKDLAKAIREADSDFFASAEVWKEDGKPRLVVLWSLELDTGSQIRAMACVGTDGKPSSMHVTNWSIPVDGSTGGWIHEQIETFDPSGKVLSKQGYFVDWKGNRTSAPKLDEDSTGSFEWVPGVDVIQKVESDLTGAMRKEFKK